jgi:hypothetical protein
VQPAGCCRQSAGRPANSQRAAARGFSSARARGAEPGWRRGPLLPGGGGAGEILSRTGLRGGAVLAPRSSLSEACSSRPARGVSAPRADFARKGGRGGGAWRWGRDQSRRPLLRVRAGWRRQRGSSAARLRSAASSGSSQWPAQAEAGGGGGVRAADLLSRGAGARATRLLLRLALLGRSAGLHARLLFDQAFILASAHGCRPSRCPPAPSRTLAAIAAARAPMALCNGDSKVSSWLGVPASLPSRGREIPRLGSPAGSPSPPLSPAGRRPPAARAAARRRVSSRACGAFLVGRTGLCRFCVVSRPGRWGGLRSPRPRHRPRLPRAAAGNGARAEGV